MISKTKLFIGLAIIFLLLNYNTFASSNDTLKNKIYFGISISDMISFFQNKEFASYYSKNYLPYLVTPNFRLIFNRNENIFLTVTIGCNSGIYTKRKNAKRKIYKPENLYVVVPLALSISKEKKYGCYGVTLNIINTLGHRYHFGYIGKGELVETTYFYRPAFNLSFDGGVKMGRNLKFVLSPGICFQYKNSRYSEIHRMERAVFGTVGISLIYDFKFKRN